MSKLKQSNDKKLVRISQNYSEMQNCSRIDINNSTENDSVELYSAIPILSAMPPSPCSVYDPILTCSLSQYADAVSVAVAD